MGASKNTKILVSIKSRSKRRVAYLKDKTFDKSDHLIGRNLSCLIKLSWTEAEVKQRAQTMAKLISEASA